MLSSNIDVLGSGIKWFSDTEAGSIEGSLRSLKGFSGLFSPLPSCLATRRLPLFMYWGILRRWGWLVLDKRSHWGVPYLQVCSGLLGARDSEIRFSFYFLPSACSPQVSPPEVANLDLTFAALCIMSLTRLKRTFSSTGFSKP